MVMTAALQAEQPRVWFITGVSRGCGRQLAESAIAQGDLVIGTTRNGQTDITASPDQLRVLAMDVTRPAEVTAAVDEAWRTHGHVDIVVNNAGFGLLGAVEEVEE